MAIPFSCPRCDRSYSVADTLGGRRIKCKDCGQEQTIPLAVAETGAIPYASPRGEESAYENLPRPGRIPKASNVSKRRNTADAGLPWLVKGLLGLVGLLVVSSIVVVGGIALAHGESQLAGIMAGALLFVLLLGVVMVAFLKMVFRVQAERGTGAALVAFNFPLLGLLMGSGAEKRGPASVLAIVAVIIAAVAAAFIYLPERADDLWDRAPRQAQTEEIPPPMPGEEVLGRGVEVRVRGLTDEAARSWFADHLGRLVQSTQQHNGIQVSSTGLIGDTCTFVARPVQDIDAFAAAMTIGDITHRDGRILEVVARLPATIP